jgi:rubrerythrin
VSSQPAPGPRTLQELMAHACAFEREAVERYTEFAEVLETHNNRDAAALFRSLATQEARHAEELMRSMGWQQPPSPPSAQQAPRGADLQQAHYLMQPWHALEIALRCEREAQKYYAGIAASRAPKPVRDAAREMAAEEAEHVRLIKAWMTRVPKPPAGWDEDPDPPGVR